MRTPSNPIGVFDSGVGGLTVLKALTETLPHEDFIYLGDTARVPYGDKSPATITHYALQAAHSLAQRDIKMLVVACNTVTALALPILQSALPHLPCVGVIEPTARQAAHFSLQGRIAVLSTEATARHDSYRAVIKHYRQDSEVRMLACGALVDMVEEGMCEGAEVEAVLAGYLGQLDKDYDTLVLGCTHFPFLAATIRKLVAPDVAIVDGVKATAQAARDDLIAHGLMNVSSDQGQVDFYTTGAPERFAAVAKRFLDAEFLPPVELAGFDEEKISAA